MQQCLLLNLLRKLDTLLRPFVGKCVDVYLVYSNGLQKKGVNDIGAKSTEVGKVLNASLTNRSRSSHKKVRDVGLTKPIKYIPQIKQPSVIIFQSSISFSKPQHVSVTV